MAVHADDLAALDVRALFAMARRRWRWLVLLPLVGAAVGFGLATLGPTRHAATATIVFRAQDGGLAPFRGTEAETQRALQNEAQDAIAAVDPEAVGARVGGPVEITADARADANVVAVRASARTEAAAVDGANAAAQAYLDGRRARRREALDALAGRLRQQATALQAEVQELENQIATDLATRAAGATGPVAPDPDLTGARDALLGRQGRLRNEASELSLALAGVDDAQLTPAIEAGTEGRPPLVGAALAAFAGLVVAVAVAITRERLDDDLGTRQGLERVAPDVPLLAEIPRRRGGRRRDDRGRDEAYRLLRATLRSKGHGDAVQVVQVAPLLATAGPATAVAVNLARAVARTGRRVVVLDGLADGTGLRLEGLDASRGLWTVPLSVDAVLGELQDDPDHPHVRFLLGGPPADDAEQRFVERRLAVALESVQRVADVVIVDSPPLLPGGHGLSLASRATATVVVLSGRTARAEHLDWARYTLLRSGGTLAGCVIDHGDVLEAARAHETRRGSGAPAGEPQPTAVTAG